MEPAQPQALLAAIAIQLGLSATALAADATASEPVVVVPVIDATESAEITMPQPSLVLPGEDAIGPAPEASASSPPVTSTADGYRAAATPGSERRVQEADQHAPSGRWLQIGSNKDPVRGRFRVNRSSAIVGIALGF